MNRRPRSHCRGIMGLVTLGIVVIGSAAGIAVNWLSRLPSCAACHWPVLQSPSPMSRPWLTLQRPAPGRGSWDLWNLCPPRHEACESEDDIANFDR